jgi:hypothetical protein
VLVAALVVQACRAPAETPAKVPDPAAPSPMARPTAGAPEVAMSATGGSSDGKTCEEARDQYVEEIAVGSSGPADLTADDFAAVLNNGAYLTPCEVPGSSKVRICAAVQNGRAVGVTVALDPPSAEVEICVATQVRQLAFPAHAKLDVVSVRF